MKKVFFVLVIFIGYYLRRSPVISQSMLEEPLSRYIR